MNVQKLRTYNHVGFLFRGLNFRGLPVNCKKSENWIPQKFLATRLWSLTTCIWSIWDRGDGCDAIYTLGPSRAVGPDMTTHRLKGLPVPATEDIHGAQRKTLLS